MSADAMKRTHDNRGQGLLETIIALGVIIAGTVGTISLLIATMNAGKASRNTEIATNLAREAVEVARNIRDSNWLKIQANEAGVGTFDGLFDPASSHHVRFPVFYRYKNPIEFYGDPVDQPENSSWVFADTDDFMNYHGSLTGYESTAYSDAIVYDSSNSMCAYPDPADSTANSAVSYPCATVFQNDDTWWPSYDYRGVGYGYFNQMPLYPRPLIGVWYNSQYPRSCPPEHPTCTDNIYPVTTSTGFKRWVTINPICRKDEDPVDGIPDNLPAESDSETIITADGSTCPPDQILVGLQVISTVSWGAGVCPGKECVQIEDRLYNWRYVK